VALVGITALWGVSFVIVKEAVAHADPFVFLSIRFGCGAALAAAWARRRMGRIRNARVGLGLGLPLFIGYAFQTVGLRHTTASRSAFVTGLSVAFVPLLQMALFRKLPRPATWAGIALCLFGLWLFTGGQGDGASPTLYGDALTLGCALAFGLHILLMGHLSQRSDPAAQVSFQLATVAVASTAVAWGRGVPFTLTLGGWAAALFCGAVVSAFAISVQAWAQAKTSPVRAGLIFSLEPLFAAAFAALWSGERLTSWEAAGGFFMLAGVVLAEAVGGKEERA
jgi:drug/metabolite transporter (DMT)-like permease